MSKTTFYVGGNEIILNHNANKTDIKRHIAGKVIVTLTNVNSAGTAASTDTKYLLRDQLGSVISILNGSGSAQEMNFDPWGQRNAPTNWQSLLGNYPSNPAQFTVTTNRGFTGHEMVDTMGLIHMNGRIYDPKLGRFMQADPFVQAPGNTQSYNRYAYVYNNPLIYTDPSGYIVFTLAAIALTSFNVVTGAEAVIAVFAVAGFADTLAAGGSVGDAFKNGIIAGVSAGAFSAMGGANLGDLWGIGETATRTLGFSAVGGITSVLQGGKFGHGFITAGVGSYLGGAKVLGRVRNPGIQSIGRIVVGGTLSKATGGKFANGAAGAAFAFIVSSAAQAASSRGGFDNISADVSTSTAVDGIDVNDAVAVPALEVDQTVRSAPALSAHDPAGVIEEVIVRGVSLKRVNVPGAFIQQTVTAQQFISSRLRGADQAAYYGIVMPTTAVVGGVALRAGRAAYKGLPAQRRLDLAEGLRKAIGQGASEALEIELPRIPSNRNPAIYRPK